MFGKRKEDRKHRFAEEGLGDEPDGQETPESEDPELMAALLQLGLNRHAPLVDPPPAEAREPDGPAELDAAELPESLGL
jgi:hypothetical protein